ncbi:MAG: chemotaxis protein CheC [Halobacteriales archaeon]
MEIDINALKTYNRLADRGTRKAAESLATFAGVETSVEATRLSYVSSGELRERLRETEYVGVQIEFEGHLTGDAVLLFDAESARQFGESLTDWVLESGAGLERSGIKETGNIMLSGFVDGWADYLSAPIDISPPTYLEHDLGAPLAGFEHGTGEPAFLFESRVQIVDEPVSFSVYFRPDHGPFAELLAARSEEGGDTFALEKLAALDDVVTQGATGAAEALTGLTGIETTVDVSRLDFALVENVPETVGTTTRAGTVTQLEAPPGGYFAVLFTESAALDAAGALMPGGMGGDGFGDMTQSAVEEIGNVVTSGFIDGWANTIGSEIPHEPPSFVHDMGEAILDPIAARIAREQELAFVIDAVIRAGGDAFDCSLYSIPDNEALNETLVELPGPEGNAAPAERADATTFADIHEGSE